LRRFSAGFDDDDDDDIEVDEEEDMDSVDYAAEVGWCKLKPVWKVPGFRS